MDLRVDDDAMKALVAKSIVDGLTPEMREKLIKDAITNLLTKGSDGYSKKAPIEQAFNNAVEQEARRYAGEVLTSDPKFQQQLQSLFADVAAKLFATETRDDLVAGIAQTITRALTKDRY